MTSASPPTYADLTARAAALGAALAATGLVMATAESCTGGLIGHLITEIPGSSDYFAGGAIVYSNQAKATILGVPTATLDEHGAVSAATAQAIAQGALRLYAVDVAVSVTGIAGPGGARPGKPTGTTYLHVSAADGYEAGAHFVWTSDRSGNKLLSAAAAFDLIQTYLDQRRSA